MQHDASLKELGRDYMMAGFFDRAEGAFQSLLHNDVHHEEVQDYLFNIYQTTKEWKQAIQLGQAVLNEYGSNHAVEQRMAHYYCELALVAQKNDQKDEAQRYLSLSY